MFNGFVYEDKLNNVFWKIYYRQMLQLLRGMSRLSPSGDILVGIGAKIVNG